MKSSIVNFSDVNESNETSPSAGSSTGNESTSRTEDSAQQRDSMSRRNSRTIRSQSPRNDQLDQTTSATSYVVNFVDFDETEVAPPSLSRQEPVSVAAPRVTLIPTRQRMIVDVDEFIDIENKEDFSNSTDDSMPSALSSPKRSASQLAAIQAVLGSDDFDDGARDDVKKIDEKHGGVCSDSVAGYTVDLSEDEIAAIIPPDLQRQTGSLNSTPGAFPVRGRGDVVAPIPSTLARSSTRRPQTDVEEYGDGIHMISATLVANGADDAPMLVYAERLWWKRRFVLCLSVWILVAITAISVSITLAVRLTDENESKEPKDLVGGSIDKSSPTQSTTTKSPSNSPSIDVTASPSDRSPWPTLITDPPETMNSTHAAAWGILTDCSEFSEVQSSEMIISCNGDGRIVLESYDNVNCKIENDKLSCRLDSSEPYIDIYQQATGLVMFSCRGTAIIDLLATAELFNTTVTNCATSSSTPATASTFVSMGRFCRSGSNVEFLDTLVNDCVSSETCNVVIPEVNLLCKGVGPDDRYRKLGFWDDIGFDDEVKGFWQDLGDEAFGFCYESTSCPNQNTGTASDTKCSVPDLTSLNKASSFEGCMDPGYDETIVEYLWNATHEKLDPSKRLEVLVGII